VLLTLFINLELNGLNYLAQSRSIQPALGTKNKLKFIGSSIVIPNFIDLNHNHIVGNNAITSSILGFSIFVSDQIASTIVFHESLLMYGRFERTILKSL
jgi:hypothetical protein